MAEAQNYKNHGRLVPVYHIGVFGILVINLFYAGYLLAQSAGTASVIGLLMAVALILMFFSVRVQILTVQDRVIRLEMRLRLQALLPREVAARAEQLPVKQLVALRFASDAELPGLVNEVLAGQLTTGKDIKLRVKDWQGDFLRA
jgi:hypothetical protein